MSRPEVAEYLRRFADRLDGRATDGGVRADTFAERRAGATERRDEFESGATGPDGRYDERDDDRRDGEQYDGDRDDGPGEHGEGRTDDGRAVDDRDHRVDLDHLGTDRGTEAAAGERAEDRPAAPSTRGKITFVAGNDSATVNPPETITFSVDVDSRSAIMSGRETERVTFTIAWDAADVPADDELRVL